MSGKLQLTYTLHVTCNMFDHLHVHNIYLSCLLGRLVIINESFKMDMGKGNFFKIKNKFFARRF